MKETAPYSLVYLVFVGKEVLRAKVLICFILISETSFEK